MLPEFGMAGESLFQAVGAAEEKQRAAVLIRDFGTISKSISADLSLRHGTY